MKRLIYILMISLCSVNAFSQFEENKQATDKFDNVKVTIGADFAL